MQLEYWPITKLIPYGRNPRKNDQAIERMMASIKEFGFKVPILARSGGQVVDGHLRLKAAQKMGMTELPVILCDEWTDAQVKAFRLLINRSVNWADWDVELVALEMGELAGMDFDLSLTGFDPVEIDAFLLDDANEQSAELTPPVPEEPVTRMGDLWICGEHRVLCGDSTTAEAVARLLGASEPAL